MDSRPQLKGIFNLLARGLLSGISECAVGINSVMLNKLQPVSNSPPPQYHVICLYV